MRAALTALLILCAGACASFGRAPIGDLTPVFADSGAFHNQVFEGEVYVVRPWPRQRVKVALALDAESYIELDDWSARRLENYYGYGHGHRIRIRAIIREERIILTQAAAANACAPMQYSATFYLTQVQVLRGPL